MTDRSRERGQRSPSFFGTASSIGLLRIGEALPIVASSKEFLRKRFAFICIKQDGPNYKRSVRRRSMNNEQIPPIHKGA